MADRSCHPKTTLGLREISYLADPLTQVSSPFTQELFSVEFLPVRLDRPWALEFLPDGTMLVTEKKGRIVLVANGAVKLLRRIRPLVVAESGLPGLAVDPDFATTRRVYAYYTSKSCFTQHVFPFISSRYFGYQLRTFTLRNATILICRSEVNSISCWVRRQRN